ncbi:sigma-E factor negative regulatory protein [Kangiella sediminilitoris]|uniref:Anti sigma-E protein, RseA n=1 Tax=Kangiella sediminilitoris TaxID=1144748 RepID=A0A1B3BCC3_9GAMM|nr:RseA family anti-sigma factor [Kangiella sediminilitoris]AOE50403.1 Anti sigma-E protein, RseA [Kangiella sediminilitoris]
MSDTRRFDKELLSAWVDGQTSTNNNGLMDEESLEQGSESMSVWARYHMIGQIMREETHSPDLDISGKVSQAIADEPAHQAKAADSNVIAFPSRLWKQAGGMAIAASVALVALFSMSNTQTDIFATEQLAAQNKQMNAANTSTAAIASNANREELQRMHDMFLKHEALTRQITGMSSLPTVTVVSNQKVIPVQVPMRALEQKGHEKEQYEESQE